MPTNVPATPSEPPTAASELTNRQQQILALLQAGKVNKEIARELGISLGTVKQHVVALFKKLKARNRAMAVSKGIAVQRPQAPAMAGANLSGLLERRPCIVLSMALPAEANPEARYRLHGLLDAQATANGGLYLSQGGNVGDVILGVQRVTEYDLLKVVRIAQAVLEQLKETYPADAPRLRAALTAGIAVASMGRYGGWTGEAIASSTISAAHNLVANETIEGKLSIGAGARDLMTTCGLAGLGGADGLMPLDRLAELVWTGERPRFRLVGRDAEYAALEHGLVEARSGSGGFVYLEGETGMGKSRLCDALAEQAKKQGDAYAYWRCLPGDTADTMRNTVTGTVSGIADAKLWTTVGKKRLLIIDDLHFLAPEHWGALLARVENLATHGVYVVLAGRRQNEALGYSGKIVRLGRLDDKVVLNLASAVLQAQKQGDAADTAKAVVRLAAGVPLFVVELASHGGALSLPVFSVVCARLDGLKLDRRLLKAVARGQSSDAKALAKSWEEDEPIVSSAIERAMASGVLKRSSGGQLDFSHPLLRAAVDYIGTESP